MYRFVYDQIESQRGYLLAQDQRLFPLGLIHLYLVRLLLEIEGNCIYLQQLVFQSSMEFTETLFSQSAVQALGKHLFTCKATKSDEKEITIELYEKCMVETLSSKFKSYLFYDYDVKFSFQQDTLTVVFEKYAEKCTYHLKSKDELQAWRDVLKSRINQRGFHEQFKPKKKIGKGNFASVYLAEKLEDGKSYAVKAFSKEAAYSEQKGKECLIKQIEIMRSLSHKYCMKLYQVFESQNSIYIVVELLEGGQLYDKIKNKYRFKPSQTKKIIFTILSGLKEMHSKKVMHRDLKPENIIFRSQNNFECVIADFGLAEFADSFEYLFVRCGTPGYVAPEVINIKDMKAKYDPICDIFSLGIIFHILLLGVSAFSGKTYNEVIAQNRASTFYFQTEQYRKMDPVAFSLLTKMLKKSPNQRITAVQALNHPYFSQQMDDYREQEDKVLQLEKKKSYPSCDSPLLTTANNARKQEQLTKKDSCVDFVMGKQNIFTGKVQTITETSSTNNSVNTKMQSVQMPKVSKFNLKK